MTFDPDSEPDFINDEGVKWWHQRDTTNYARRKGLKSCNVWVAETPDGMREYLVTEGGSIVAGCPTLEGIAIKIDALAFLKKNPH